MVGAVKVAWTYHQIKGGASRSICTLPLSVCNHVPHEANFKLGPAPIETKIAGTRALPSFKIGQR
jgi:hypothetical protein